MIKQKQKQKNRSRNTKLKEILFPQTQLLIALSHSPSCVMSFMA